MLQTKTQNKHVFWYIYAIAAVFFVMYSVICFYPINLEPTQATWSIPSSMPSGMRYSGSTYYASTPQEFLYAISRPSSITIELVDNIDFSGNNYPKIIKSNSITINGNGYSILNVDINSSDRIGIIGETNSSVTITSVNLYIDIDHTTTTASRIGGFVGYARSTVTINNCTVSGDIDVTSNATHYVGGFVGYSSNTISINNSVNYVDINTVGASRVGGVVGYASSTSTTLSVCANFGDIQGATGNIGGLIGYSQGNQTFSTNFNSGNITGTTGNIGGLVGYTTNSFTIRSCYNTGDITGGDTNYVGGLVGYASSRLTINYCYSSGLLNSDNEGNVNYGSYDSTTRKIGEYIVEGQLYSQAISDFPQSSTLGGDNTPPASSIVLSSIRPINSVTYLSLIGYGTANVTNSYYYSSISISGNIPWYEVYISAQDGSTGELTPLTTFVVNSNGTFTYTTNNNGGRSYPQNIVGGGQPRLLSNDIDTNASLFWRLPWINPSRYIDSFRTGDYNTGANAWINFKFGDEYQYVPLPYTDVRKNATKNGLLHFLWVYGVKPSISGNTLRLNSIFGFSLACEDGRDSSGYYMTQRFASFSDDTQSLSLTLSAAKPSVSGIGTQITSKNDIKNQNLGSAYTTNSSINDGFPILEDFYWLYS